MTWAESMINIPILRKILLSYISQLAEIDLPHLGERPCQFRVLLDEQIDSVVLNSLKHPRKKQVIRVQLWQRLTD